MPGIVNLRCSKESAETLENFGLSQVRVVKSRAVNDHHVSAIDHKSIGSLNIFCTGPQALAYSQRTTAGNVGELEHISTTRSANWLVHTVVLPAPVGPNNLSGIVKCKWVTPITVPVISKICRQWERSQAPECLLGSRSRRLF